MESIRKYLFGSQAQADRDYGRVVSLLLEGIALHMAGYEDGERCTFQDEIRKQREHLLSPENRTDTLVITGGIIQTLQSYNTSVHRQFVAERAELREIVVLLTGLLRQACRGNQRTVSSLDDVKRQLQDASELEDIRAVRSKLEACVSAVQTELERQVVDAGATQTALKTVVSKPVAKAISIENRECPTTGLPGRPQGLDRLQAASAAQVPAYAVVLTLERFSTVSHRFGDAAGQSYLLTASQMIAQKLQTGDQLFRWSGPAFLAVLERVGTLEAVQAEVQRIIRWRAEYTVVAGERSILIPASIDSLCLPIWESPGATTLVEQIDSFALKAAH